MRLYALLPMLFLSVFQLTLFGQATPFAGCDDLPAPGEISSCILCENSTPIYGSTRGYTASPQSDFCGTIENDQYIGFFAGPSGTINYQCTLDSSLLGDGIQLAIYDRFNSVVGNCTIQLFPFETVNETVQGLTPNEPYFFRVDGLAGDECGFIITILSALGSGQISSSTGTINGPNQTCTDVTTTYVLDSITSGSNFIWELYPGPLLDDITVSDPSAITPNGTANSSLGLTFDAASSSLAPGMCDTVGLRVIGTNSCGMRRYLKHPSITVCRPASSPDTVRLPVATFPHCEAGYVDPLTGSVYPAGIYYLPDTSGGTGSTCNGVLELVVEPEGSPLIIDITGSTIVCDTSAYLAANVSGGVAPYSFAWRRKGASFVPGSDTFRNINSAGRFEVRVTDALDCERIIESDTLYSAAILDTLFQDAIVSIVPTQCDSTGGAVSINPSILNDYDVEWSTGETNVSQLTNLIPGQYTFTITERTNQCTYRETIEVPVSRTCFGKITGYILYSPNLTCDSLFIATPQSGGEVQLYKDGRYFDALRTNSDGYFEFLVPPGTYHIQSVNATVLRGVTEVCRDFSDLTITQSLDSLPDNAIYWRDRIPFDAAVNLVASSPISGEILNARVIVFNGAIASDPMDYLVHITSSSNLTYESGPQNVSYDAASKVVTVNAYEVEQGRPHIFELTYRPDPNAQVGDSIFLYALVDSLTATPEDTPWNNYSRYVDTIMSPLSPFRMSVQPTGSGPEGFISISDSILQYTIGFANNTGDTVTNIRVENDISPFLNSTTVEFISTNLNPYSFSVDNGMLIVNFPGAILPPQLHNPVGNPARPVSTEGFFTFSIKVNPGLAPGTQIFNSARIYFDSLDVIHTDTSLNTIEFISGTHGPVQDGDFLVFPNPTSGDVDVKLSQTTPIELVELISLNSKHMQSIGFEQNGNTGHIATGAAHLPPGAYVLNLTLANGERLRQLLVIQ